MIPLLSILHLYLFQLTFAANTLPLNVVETLVVILHQVVNYEQLESILYLV